MSGAGGLNPNVITLLIALLVIVRFLFRELRERKLRARTLWIRPGLLAVVTVLFLAGAFAVPHVNPGLMFLSAVVGVPLGILTGYLVVRSTTFAPASERGAVLAKGNITTVIVWVVALALRLVARYAFAGTGADQAAQYELNFGLITLVFAAFVVVAIMFHREIDRLAPEATVTRTL